MLKLILTIALTPCSTYAFSQTASSTPPEQKYESKPQQGSGETQPTLQSVEPEVTRRCEMVTVSGEFPSSPLDISVDLRNVDPTTTLKTIRTDNLVTRDPPVGLV